MPLPAGIPWRKSSSSSDNGTCVEIAHLPDGRIAVRDSKYPAGGHLIVAGPVPSAWPIR
jgi:uncharacterized protein DUF397